MSALIHVLVVTRSLDTGGTERHLLQVLPRLDRARFAVQVLPLHPGGGLALAYEATGLPIYRSYKGIKRIPSLLFILIRHIRKHRPLVYTVLPEPYLFVAPLALLFGARGVVMGRRSRNYYQDKHPIAARIERFLHSRIQALIGNSEAVVEDLIAEGAPCHRVHVIHNGIDLTPFPTGTLRGQIRKNLREKLGLPDNALVLVCVANLFPYKGNSDLLNAMDKLPPELKHDTHLLCVGRDEGALPTLEKMAGLLGLHVHFLGERNDVPELLATADIGVLVSHTEGFSNAILEYMASSLPSIVSDVGGNPEAIIDGECGKIVPVKDIAALSEALSFLIKTPTLRTKMGLLARQRVEQEFSLEKCVSSYEAIYEEVFSQ